MPYDELEDITLQEDIKADADDELEAEQEDLDMLAREMGFEDWADYQAYLQELRYNEPITV